MTATAKLYLIGAALVALLIGYAGWRREVRQDAVREMVLAQSEAKVKAISKSLDSARALYRVDTLRVNRQITRTDTLLRRLIDTAVIHHRDTVWVTREVLVAADSTIRACAVTLAACGRLRALEQERGDSLASQVRLLKAARPSILTRCGISAGYGVVLADGAARMGPAILGGCRLFP